MSETMQPTNADSDDDYLDDVVVQAAIDRLLREFGDNDEVNWIGSDRFDETLPQKTDYINIQIGEVDDFTRGQIVQDAVDTGVVRVVKISQTQIRVAPTETQR